MAFLGSYVQENLRFLPSMTLTSNHLSQRSLWTKGTHPQSFVHIMCIHGQNLQAHLPNTSNHFLPCYAGQLLRPNIHAP